MLYDRLKIINVPICDRIDSEAPLPKTSGATIRIAANKPQTIPRPSLGSGWIHKKVLSRIL